MRMDDAVDRAPQQAGDRLFQISSARQRTSNYWVAHTPFDAILEENR